MHETALRLLFFRSAFYFSTTPNENNEKNKTNANENEWSLLKSRRRQVLRLLFYRRRLLFFYLKAPLNTSLSEYFSLTLSGRAGSRRHEFCFRGFPVARFFVFAGSGLHEFLFSQVLGGTHFCFCRFPADKISVRRLPAARNFVFAGSWQHDLFFLCLV